MTRSQASAHVVHIGPFSGLTIGAIANTQGGKAWLDRIRLLIPVETTGAMGQLRTAINIYLGKGAE